MWILILVLAGSDPAMPIAMTTAEFASQQTCEAAGQKFINAEQPTWAGAGYVCVAKGEQ